MGNPRPTRSALAYPMASWIRDLLVPRSVPACPGSRGNWMGRGASRRAWEVCGPCQCRPRGADGTVQTSARSFSSLSTRLCCSSRWLREDRGRLRAAGLATRRAVRSSRPAKRCSQWNPRPFLHLPRGWSFPSGLLLPPTTHAASMESKLESNSQAPFLCAGAQDAYEVTVRSA
jgi:hypothetical protein